MLSTSLSCRIGIYGPEETPGLSGRGCHLWPTGYAAAVQAAEGTPVFLGEASSARSRKKALEGVQGLIWTGNGRSAVAPTPEEQQLCAWCRKNHIPLIAVDQGLHVLNAAFGGTLHHDLARDLPEALLHRHPPEKGLRHAITVEPRTRLAEIYGEGEVVVNSEHRRAICRTARNFVVSARALDGVVEAIETEEEAWFAVGVQWRPASVSASGLDIQLFRALVDACQQRLRSRHKRTRTACSSAA
jgi:putative glutamine amidotransferase